MFRWTTIQEYYSVLKMKVLRFSAMSGTTRPTTQYHIIVDWIFRNTDMGTSTFALNKSIYPIKCTLNSLQHSQLLRSRQHQFRLPWGINLDYNLKLSQIMNSKKYSQARGLVRWLNSQWTNISRTICVLLISSMMKMMDTVFNTLLCSPFNHLVQLLVEEYFIKSYSAVFWIMTPCRLVCW